MKVVKLEDNPLLQRKSFIVSLEGKTPKIKEAKEKVAKLLGVDEKLIIIKEIRTVYGGLETIIVGKVYDNEDVLKKFARPHLIKRNTFEEKKEEESQEQ